MQASKSRLKLVFSEVIKGYSKVSSPLFGNIFIRHLNNHISADIELMTETISARASSEGLPTNSEKLKYLAENGLWTEKDETQIQDTKKFISGLRQSKSKHFLKAQLEQFSQTIKEEEDKLRLLEIKRAAYLGLTVEKYAERRINQYFMFCSAYKDERLSERFFTEGEFEELEDKYIAELVKIYNTCGEWINAFNLKKIAVSAYFLNYFHLCEDNPQVFYGKPVCDLTFNQIELFGYGRYYKSIFAECQNSIPDALLEDPDKLVEWYDSRKNAAKLLETVDKKDDMNVSLVGATKEDLVNLGIRNTGKTIDLAAEAAKKGGRLEMEDLIRLQYG
jgi:hypothetical protein